MQNSPYSVSQLNRLAKRLLSEHFMAVQVIGEISNISFPASGHLYFSLKDAQAQIRCALFKGQQTRLAFKPDNGHQVLVSGQVTLYEPRGDYQLVIEHMEEAGDGVLRMAFERLKQKLLLEGLFDGDRKKSLPLLPAQIGIITSASGAAVHDILTVLKRRFPAVPVIIYPVTVQGEQAKFEIVRALEIANEQAEVDVIILGRGGGSLEDLWAFNEEMVARAIAKSDIPVVSAVGHEVDVTIADFVADFRAATPSAAAEHVVPHQSDWLNVFVNREKQLSQLILRLLKDETQRLAWLNKSLQQQHPGQKLQRNAQRLDELEQRMTLSMTNKLAHLRQRMLISQHQMKQFDLRDKINRQKQAVLYLSQALERIMRLKLTELHQRQSALSLTLHAVSPLATLERGYAIVQRQDNQQIVKSISQVQVDDILISRVAKGQILSKVTQIEN